ncbi:hypothetical protein [Planctomycetes bacterium K23_9]|uniref:Uncharacterized protein n=1 Tax=Stieleria marina TaxID=1930275 RepID=A0A517NW89_9BACT|nr:hypothetical protein K239x_33960 [Planctomycetes bacterium K23_9]
MSNKISISLVCCQDTPAQHSQIVTIEANTSVLSDQLISEAQQNLDANESKGLHLAAEHETHGPVSYVQQVNEGGFFVYVGDPAALTEHWFGPGSYVAFVDSQGTGHASKVGPEGCKRTFRMLKGHLKPTA